MATIVLDDEGVPITEDVGSTADEVAEAWGRNLFGEYYNPNVFSFALALDYIKLGRKVARHEWNGNGVFVFLVPGSVFKVNRPPLMGIYPEGTEITYLPHIDMRTADGTIVPWLASQTDLLAEDWILV